MSWMRLAVLAGVLGSCDAPAEGCEPGATSWCAVDGGGIGRSTCTADRTFGVCEALPMLDAGPPIPEPAPPMPPVFTPCPSGWIERTDDGLTVCDPWSDAVEASCAPPRALLPGLGCVELGTPCPTGDLPDTTPAGAIHVVRGATGGDGSRASPFGTVAEALAVLAPGGVLVLGRGTYSERIALPAGATVTGSCIEDTVISTAELGVTIPAIDIQGAGTRVENLRIVTDLDTGVRVVNGASVTIHGVWIDRADVAVDAFFGATIDIEDVLITDSASNGVHVGPGVTTRVRRTHIARSYLTAIHVGTTGTADIEDVHLTGTRYVEGNAILLDQEANITGRRVVIDDGPAGALSVLGPNSSAILEDVVARDRTGTSNAGIGTYDGRIELRRARVEGWRAQGIGAADPDAVLVLEDVLVRSTRLRTGDQGTAGIELVLGATAQLSRVVVADAESVGILVDGSDTTLHATDLRISATRGISLDGQLGRAIHAQRSGSVDLVRALVEQNREASISAGGFGRVDGVDVAVIGTLPRECAAAGCDPAGMGVFVDEGGAVTLERFSIADNSLCGAQIGAAGALDLRIGRALRNTIGVCVQVDGYDVSRLTEDVAYSENGSNVDTTMLPVPETTLDIAAL